MNARQRGITLLEMMVVLALVSLLAGISFPAVTSGLESLRLRAAADDVVSFLNLGLTYAERREQAVELRISRANHRLSLRGATGQFQKEIGLPEGITIGAILPPPPGEGGVETRVLFYPGGSFPRVGVELINRKGSRRMVRLDPVAGVPVVETPAAPQNER